MAPDAMGERDDVTGPDQEAAGGSLAGLPLETRSVEAGGARWRIACVADHDALLAASDGLSAFPFGLLLWESAIVLADVVAERVCEFEHASVLELGAGVGLAGLAAARAGATVLQTDHSAEALAVCRANAAANRMTGVTQALADWTSWPLTQRFGIVLGADVLYDAGLFQDLADVLERSVGACGTAIFTDPARPHTGAFVTLMQTRGWSVTTERRAAALCQPVAGQTHATVDVLTLCRLNERCR